MATYGFWCMVGCIQPVALRPKGAGPAASQGNGQRATSDAAKAALRTLSCRFISFKKADKPAFNSFVHWLNPDLI